MGSILQGRCTCGFDTDKIFVGAGFINFMDTCNAPAICPNCGELLVRNYMEKSNARCPVCHKGVTFYDDPSLNDPSAEFEEYDYLFTWRIADKDEFFKLADIKHLCPKCKNMTLKFEDKGCWD